MARRMPFVALLAALALAACSGVPSPSGSGEAVLVDPVRTIDARDLAALASAGKVRLIDVRTPAEFAEGHIEGAINIPVERFDARAIPPVTGKQTILYCRSGRRSLRAAAMLAARDGAAIHLDGGIAAWEAAGQPVVK